MSVTCSICGTTNPDPATQPPPQYCEGCGVELTQTTLEGTPSGQTPLEQPSPEQAPPEPFPQEAASEGLSETASDVAPSSLDLEDAEGRADAAPQTEAASEAFPVEASEGERAGEVAQPEAAEVDAPEGAVPVEPAAEEVSATGGADKVVQEPLLEPPLEQDAASSEVDAGAAAPPETEVTPTPTPAAGSAPGPAFLLIKRHGAVSDERIPLEGTRLTVGRFDPSTGPVDIDVTGLPGAEHISRRHAELYAEAGVWNVRDLGSTNGVFLKPEGEASFSPRLQTPAELSDGDEIAFGNVVFVFRQG